MNFGRSPPAREREYLFIDGGCLRATVKSLCKELFGNENEYQPHIQAMAHPSTTTWGYYDKIFYYDAVPGKEHGENQAAYEARVQPDHDRFAKIQALDRVHIALGKIVGRERRQKGVDVQLAVDMMTHAFRGIITRATLFAGDADFIPLIKSLVSEGLHVTLWHPPQASADLKGAADRTRLFDFKDNYNCLTADGQRPAFLMRRNGGGNGGGSDEPAREGLSNVVVVGENKFAGRWQGGSLKVWRGGPGDGWSLCEFEVPDASLARALKVFDIVQSWGIAATGPEWIEAEHG